MQQRSSGAAPCPSSSSHGDEYLLEFLKLWLDIVITKVEVEVVKTQTAELRHKPRKTKLTKSGKLIEKRTSYSVYDKAFIAKLCDQEGATKRSVVKAVKETKGFGGFDKKGLRRILEHKPQQKRGRKVNLEFDSAVLSNLVFAVLERADDKKEELTVTANICHSYAIIERAAADARMQAQFEKDAKVQKLKFSRMWIKGFLKRSSLQRRRTTTTQKEVPPPEKVRARMEEIQAVIEQGGYTPAQIHNSDETGMCWGAGPKQQFVPETAARATAPPSDEKARFTTLETGDAAGNMLPSFHIIKCDAKGGNDLSRTRVIHKLHLEKGFTAAEGWELWLWEKTLRLETKVKGQIVVTPTTFKRPYIFNREKLTVVTCQNKAWMDTAGIAMWVELQYGPYVAESCGGKAVLVWDNCGPHKVTALQEIFKENGIRTETLPPNMTDQLQVMDLVVNAPLKAGIRRERCSQLYEYFQLFKNERYKQLAKPAHVRKMPAWDPPKPKLVDGLRTVLKVEETTLRTAKFKESMRKCFIAVGLVKESDFNHFKRYVPTKCGFLSSLHKEVYEELSAPEDSYCLGDDVADLGMVRPPADTEARERDEEGTGELPGDLIMALEGTEGDASDGDGDDGDDGNEEDMDEA